MNNRIGVAQFLELPRANQMKAMNQFHGDRLTSIDNGDPGDPKPLTPQQMQEWNQYVQWLDKQGMKGSKELDKKDISFQWFDKFVKENPKVSLKKEDIVTVQQEIDKLAQNTREFAKRKNLPNAENLMQGTSKFDGIPGSKTTSFLFPEMQLKEYRNDNLVKNKNLGLVNSDLKATGKGGNATGGATVPKGKKLEQMFDASGNKTGVGYVNDDGDIVIVDQ